MSTKNRKKVSKEILLMALISDREFCRDMLDTLKTELKQERNKLLNVKRDTVKQKKYRGEIKKEYFVWVKKYSNIQSQLWNTVKPKKSLGKLINELDQNRESGISFVEEMRKCSGYKDINGVN